MSFYQPSYADVLGTFGYDIAVQVDDSDYSGDTRVLFARADGSYGWLQFGWGSCSGCDALQACDSQEDVDNLSAQLKSEIKWFASTAAALVFFQTHDWEGDYCHKKEQKDFIEQSVTFLSKVANGN